MDISLCGFCAVRWIFNCLLHRFFRAPEGRREQNSPLLISIALNPYLCSWF